jgi:hypothetical protein
MDETATKILPQKNLWQPQRRNSHDIKSDLDLWGFARLRLSRRGFRPRLLVRRPGCAAMTPVLPQVELMLGELPLAHMIFIFMRQRERRKGHKRLLLRK